MKEAKRFSQKTVPSKSVTQGCVLTPLWNCPIHWSSEFEYWSVPNGTEEKKNNSEDCVHRNLFCSPVLNFMKTQQGSFQALSKYLSYSFYFPGFFCKGKWGNCWRDEWLVNTCTARFKIQYLFIFPYSSPLLLKWILFLYSKNNRFSYWRRTCFQCKTRTKSL